MINPSILITNVIAITGILFLIQDNNKWGNLFFYDNMKYILNILND